MHFWKEICYIVCTSKFFPKKKQRYQKLFLSINAEKKRLSNKVQKKILEDPSSSKYNSPNKVCCFLSNRQMMGPFSAYIYPIFSRTKDDSSQAVRKNKVKKSVFFY